MHAVPYAQPGNAGNPGGLGARGLKALGRLKGSVAGGAGVLALVMGERLCQGLAIQALGSRMRILRFAEVEVNAPPLRVRPRIQALLNRLDATGIPIRNVVVVSPEVRGMQLDLSLPPMKSSRGKRKTPDPKTMTRLLLQAARAELATGLDITPEQHLISVLPLSQSAQDAFAFEDEDEHALASVPAMAFAITRKHYESLHSILAEFKKNLLGVLPPECFAFATGEAVVQLPCPTGNDDTGAEACLPEDTQCLVYSNGYELQGARFSEDGVERFALEAISPGEPLELVLPRLMQQLVDQQEYLSVVLGGVLKDGDKTLDITPEMLPDLDPAWGVDRLAVYGAPGELDRIESAGPLSPRYMLAAGAAVAALRGKDATQAMLLHSRESLLGRVRESPALVPAAIVVIALLAMGGLQLHVRMKTAYLNLSMASLKEQKEDIEADVKRERDLQTRLNTLKRNVAEQERTKQLLTGEIALRSQRLALLLRGLVVDTPQEIMLTRFEQLSDEAYTLEGVGTSSAIISQYLLQLRNTGIVKDTRLVKTSPAKAPTDPRRKAEEQEATLLEFSIRISLEEAK